MKKKKRIKTSKARGVYWARQKKRWIMRIRHLGIQLLCKTEIEAICHYNAVCRVIWPKEAVNNIVLFRRNDWFDGDHRRIIDVGEKDMIVNFKEDISPVNFETFEVKELFYRDGWVQLVDYNKTKNSFTYRRLAELIHGGPVAFANGNRLDYRWKNLIDPKPAVILEDEEEVEPVEVVPGSAEAVDVCSLEYMESLAKGSTPKPALPVSE